MRIKKIEVTGFKSFCDRTLLSFSEPITAVVGPNGCGKSNVVDAIRWCMGEQSAKHLRGKEMQDVIFAGSDSRGPSGMAEVCLTFENDGRVPIEYLNYSEIAVTRRLFRDGSSDYLINKVPVRLRDVVDLFLGTGVGTRAYSIIEQGRIGFIVSSKPEERRLLIEEAAGITKYKLKKKAAERKMEATRQNLLRLSDVIGEIEKRLGSLRRQAQKAERYKKYKHEVRDIELWGASHRWLGLIAMERVAGESMTTLTGQRDAHAAERLRHETEIEATRAELMTEERRLTGLQEHLYEVDGRVKVLENQIEFEAREASDLEKRKLTSSGEMEELERRVGDMRTELEAAEAITQKLDSEAQELGDELGMSESRYRTLREELVRVQGEVDRHKQTIGQAESAMARAEQRVLAEGRRSDDLALRLAKLEAEDKACKERAEEHGSEVKRLGKQLAALRQTKLDLGSQKETHEARLGELKQAVARSEIELETLRTELHRRKSRHTSLKEIEERYEGFQRGVRAIMQSEQREHGVRGLVADIVAAPAEYETAVEAVLGERLGSIVVESHEAGVEAIDYLKQRSEGRGTFIPVDLRMGAAEGSAGESAKAMTDCVPPGARPLLELVGFDRNYDRVATYLFGDVVVVDDLQHALALWKRGSRATFVTRDGEVVDAHGVVTGGSRETGAGVLGQKRELRELSEIIARIESDYQDVLQRHVTTKSEISAVSKAIEAVTKDAHQGEIQILTAEKDLARAALEAERARSRIQALGTERAELERTRADAVQQAEQQRMELAAARSAHGDATRALLGLKDEAERLLGEVDAASSRGTELKVRAAQAKEQQTAAHRAAQRSREIVADLEQRRERLAQGIEDGAGRAAFLREKVERAQAELASALKESQELGARVGEGRSAYDARVHTLTSAEHDLKLLRQEHERLIEELHAIESRHEKLALDRNHLEEAMLERYQVTLGKECGQYHLRALMGETEESRLRELRSLIERMGEINLMAIEECAEIEQRFGFLSQQKHDLETALEQLGTAIARINRASKTRFAETFTAIDAKFQEVFPRLFQGGRAHLQLTAADDVLDAGVEIVAQPPGKKLQTVELLSGGEKALTAVALIFSIFLIKPSPFCLLDEVDAPLDEANVMRYNEMIREMTDRSQFIVITHNKRTMEIADHLYGVTMEEPGISKIVSVNLRKGPQKGEERAA